MKQLFNQFGKSIKQFAYLALFGSFLILSSCATGGGDENKEETIVDPKPPVIDGLEEIVEKVKKSDQYIRFVRGSGTSLTDKEVGFGIFRGYDRFVALRQDLSDDKKLNKNNVAFIGFGINTTLINNNYVYNCGLPTGTNCPNINSTITATSTLSTSSYGMFINPYSISGSATNPMGFGFGMENTALLIVEQNGTNNDKFQFSYGTINASVDLASGAGYSLIVYDYINTFRVKGTYAGNGYLDSTTEMVNVNIDGKQDVAAVANLSRIGNNFASFLKSSPNNGLVLPTGSMVKMSSGSMTGSSAISITGANNNANIQVSNEYFNTNLMYTTNTNSLAGDTIVFTTGAMVTGNIVQSILAVDKNLGKQVAMSMPVYAVSTGDYSLGKGDIVYRPHESAVLAGSLRNYVFSIPVHKTPATGSNNPYLQADAAAQAEVNGRIANSILASHIHTLSIYYNTNNAGAITQLNSKYTLKKYGENGTNGVGSEANLGTSGTLNSGGLYSVQASNLPSVIASNTNHKKSMISYFDEYAKQHGNTISDPDSAFAGSQSYDPNGTEAAKWNAINNLYAGNTHHMVKFITNADVVVYEGTKIISVNGVAAHGTKPKEFITYKYYDKNGKLVEGTTVVYYDESGKVIPSNVYGNGIVDGSMIGNEKIKGKDGKEFYIMQTALRTSSVFGDAFQGTALNTFLNDLNVEVASIYEESLETLEEGEEELKLSLSKAISSSTLRKERMSAAIETFVNSKSKSNFQVVNLGTSSFGFMAGMNDVESLDKTVKIARFGEVVALEGSSLGFNKDEVYGKKDRSGFVDTFSFGFNIGDTASVYLLSEGKSITTLSLSSFKDEAFSLTSISSGFTESYSNFVDIFEEKANIQGASFKFNHSENLNTAFVLAVAEDENREENKQSMLFNMQMGYAKADYTILATSGVLIEQGAMLGSKGTEGFYLNQTDTYFMSIDAERRLIGNLFINAGFTFGASSVNSNNSLITGVNNLTSKALSFGISHKNVFSGTLSFNYFEGLRINSGSISIFNGEEEMAFDLKPEGKERNFEVAYSKKANKDGEVKFGFVHTRDAYNQKGEVSNVAVIKFTQKF